MRRPSTYTIIILALLVGLSALTTGILLANRTPALATPLPQTDVAGVTSIPTGSVSTTPAPWYVDLPPTERAIEEQKEALRQAQIQTVTAMATQGVTPPPIPTLNLSEPGVSPITNGTRSAGAGAIIDLMLDLPFRRSFEVRNVWTASLEGVQVIVYAGYDRKSPNLGGVYVQWGDPSNSHPTRNNQYYPAPFNIGPVRITDATGTTLLLTADNNTTVQFDVLTGLFQGGSNEPTPAPSITTPTTPAYPAPVTPIPATPVPATVAPATN